MIFKHNTIEPNEVHDTLAKHLLVDGFSVVVDLEKSNGSTLHCSKSGKQYLDFFSFFASNPLGFNHPSLNSYETEGRLLAAARVKVSNSDKYTTYMAEFVDTIERTCGVPELPNYFFIEGGALAVENAMKVAFDWKARLFEINNADCNRMQILHFKHAFHGRSGYTMSVTNTDPTKTDLFPKFDWARIEPPTMCFPFNEQTGLLKALNALAQIEEAFQRAESTARPIAAILIEPIQGEGGDNHFHPTFFTGLRELADKYGALLIYDEVQTGVGMTGKWWAYQQHNIMPDILVFGKKMQLGGIMVSNRVHKVKDNVFQKPSRINSTWGGGLVDMVRATAILETIVNEKLLDNATARGNQLLDGLKELTQQFNCVSNARGSGLMCAVDLPSKQFRQTVIENCFHNGMIVLPCGEKSIRFRPALMVTQECITKGLTKLTEALNSINKT